MKHSIKIMWISFAVLLMLNALDAMTFNLFAPMMNPSLDSFMNRLVEAFISFVFAAVIIVYVKNG